MARMCLGRTVARTCRVPSYKEFEGCHLGTTIGDRSQALSTLRNLNLRASPKVTRSWSLARRRKVTKHTHTHTTAYLATINRCITACRGAPLRT